MIHSIKERISDMKKRITAAAVALTCVMAFTGCSESILNSGSNQSGAGNSSDETSSSIWTANNDDIVAWVTADGLTEEEKKYYDIPFEEFYREYSFNCANLGIDENNAYYAEYAMAYRKNIIDMLANERIILKQAEKLGFNNLSDEDMKQIDANLQENLDTWYTSYTAQAKNDLGLTDTEEGSLTAEQKQQITDKCKELFGKYIEGFGITEETFLTWEKNIYIERKTLQYIYKDITVTDKEVDDEIADLIEKAKAAYEKDVYLYESDTDYNQVWVPEGTRVVKHVFISMNTSDAAEIYAARLESGADQAEIDKMRDEKLAEIKDKIDAAYKKATAEGADFDAIVKEYSNNYNAEKESQTNTIVKGTTALPDELYDAVFSIENVGGFSEIIPTDAGYYFFQYVEDEKVTDEEMEEIKKTTKENMLNERQNEKANNAIEEWSKAVVYEFDYEKLNIEMSSDTDDTSSGDEAASDDTTTE